MTPLSRKGARPCPICAGLERHVLHRQRFESGLLGDGYDVVVCGNCGAGFADGIPAQEELDRYYAEQSKYTYGGDGDESVYDMRRFAAIVEHVAPRLRSREARILDLGCATGGLLRLLRDRGFTNVLGADPSPSCAQLARQRHGVEVRVATLADVSGWEEKFDLILMVGVLEHVREVQSAVQSIIPRLEGAGQLFVAVPDVEGLADSRNAPFQQFSMEHVNFFSRSSLDRLLAGCDLTPAAHWQYTVEWRENITEPILSGLYAAGASPGQNRDEVTGRALARYIASGAADEARIQATIARIAATGIPFLIWGTGALTRRLLATTDLARANITGFVDSNVQQHGRQLAGRPVFAPAEIAGRGESILVCSIAFEREIVATIRTRLALSNPVLTLYGPAIETSKSQGK